MKKLSVISNQIKNNTYSYTGKGAFEAVVNNFKAEIVSWLEELVPLQQQIEFLEEKANIQFQKRNYTRILTKILPKEYTEFVSVNILVRDSNIIAQYYHDEFNLTKLYELLIKNKYLKYPGKYEKYVEFEIFQKFIMMYRDELLTSLENNSIDENLKQNSIDNNEIEIPVENEILHEESQGDTETNWTNLLLGR